MLGDYSSLSIPSVSGLHQFFSYFLHSYNCICFSMATYWGLISLLYIHVTLCFVCTIYHNKKLFQHYKILTFWCPLIWSMCQSHFHFYNCNGNNLYTCMFALNLAGMGLCNCEGSGTLSGEGQLQVGHACTGCKSGCSSWTEQTDCRFSCKHQSCHTASHSWLLLQRLIPATQWVWEIQ